MAHGNEKGIEGVKKGITIQIQRGKGGGDIFFHPDTLEAFAQSLKPYVNKKGWVRCKLGVNRDVESKTSHYITGDVINRLSQDAENRQTKVVGPTHYKQAG